ncbi:hypothetical protein X726_28775 [Mesorhizobium sp. L103C105A0]|nr:hypothetical protein X726_28775 [Mesorhizobium sp. L103C105A0]
MFRTLRIPTLISRFPFGQNAIIRVDEVLAALASASPATTNWRTSRLLFESAS